MSLQNDHILTRLQKYIREQMNEAADHLAAGGGASMEEYNRMVGRIEGMAYIEREMIDLTKRLETDDD